MKPYFGGENLRRICPLWMLTIFALAFAVSACGGNDSSSANGSNNPPPFDSAKGEGKPSKSLTLAITTYSTGNPTSDGSNDTPVNPALDTYYTETICPSGLTQAQCTQNEQNLNTADFGNFDVTADPIANNPLGIRTVDASKIVYTAINVNGAAVMVSGGITIPELAPKSIKGIILFFHGTT